MTVSVETIVGRDLALEARVRELAADRSLWEPFVAFTEPRLKLRLDAGPDVEAWLLTWAPGQGTGLHDHGGATGCFVVLQESVWETVIDTDGIAHELRYDTGDIRSFDTDVIHDVRNDGTVGAVTLHIYRPEITSMTHYTATDGTVTAVETRFAGIDW